MAVETEFKFVLKNPEALRDLLVKGGGDCNEIDQVYISKGARFRRSRRVRLNKGVLDTPANFGAAYSFTYKQMIDGRLLEMEMTASREDFDLALKADIGRLRKLRFRVYFEGNTWDIDFLIDENNAIYFAMAEVEVYPEDAQCPAVPKKLAPYVEFVVPREHSYIFTNARLTDREYADRVMEIYREETAIA